MTLAGYLTIVAPLELLRGQVNQTSFAYPLQTLAYDNGTVGDSDLGGVANMLLTLYTDSTLSAVKAQLRVAAGGWTGSTSGIIQVEEISQFRAVVTNDDWFTITLESRVFPLLVSSDSAFNKDSRTAYTDEGDDPAPLATSGGPVVGWADTGSGSVQVQLDGSDSRAIDPDNTGGLTHAWDRVDDPSTSLGNVANLTTVLSAGTGWVRHVVTDADSGKTATQYVPYAIYRRDQAANLPTPVIVDSLTADLQSGWRMTFQAPGDSGLDVLPLGARVVFWTSASRDNTQGAVLFDGYLDADSVQVDPDRDAIRFDALSAFALLAETPALPQLVRNSGSDWQYVKALTVWRALWYIFVYGTSFLTWHDLVLDALDTYLFERLEIQGGTIAAQVQDIAGSIGVKALPQANGGVRLLRWYNYLTQTDRNSRGVDRALTTANVLSVTVPTQARRRVRVVESEAFIANGGGVAFAQWGAAPGTGTAAQTLDRQIVASVDELYIRTGHYAAELDGTYYDAGTQRVYTVPQGVQVTVDPTAGLLNPGDVVTINLAAATNRRGLAFSTDTFIVQSAAVQYQPRDVPGGGQTWARSVTYTLDHEALGTPGVFKPPPPQEAGGVGDFGGGIQFDPFDPGGFEFEEPVVFTGSGLGVKNMLVLANVAGGIATASAGDTLTSDATFTDIAPGSFTETPQWAAVDPFNPGNYYIAATNEIWYVTDLFGSPTFQLVHQETEAQTVTFHQIETSPYRDGWAIAAAGSNYLVVIQRGGAAWSVTPVAAEPASPISKFGAATRIAVPWHNAGGQVIVSGYFPTGRRVIERGDWGLSFVRTLRLVGGPLALDNIHAPYLAQAGGSNTGPDVELITTRSLLGLDANIEQVVGTTQATLYAPGTRDLPNPLITGIRGIDGYEDSPAAFAVAMTIRPPNQTLNVIGFTNDYFATVTASATVLQGTVSTFNVRTLSSLSVRNWIGAWGRPQGSVGGFVRISTDGGQTWQDVYADSNLNTLFGGAVKINYMQPG